LQNLGKIISLKSIDKIWQHFIRKTNLFLFCKMQKIFNEILKKFGKIILPNGSLTKFCKRKFAKLIMQQNFAQYKECFAKF